MKKRNYINCSNAAEATDKITVNGDYVFYFSSNEDAADWLNRNSEYNFHYEWEQREIDWETGEPTDEWNTVENGETENIRAFAKSFGF